MNPVFTHDCPACTFLGHHDGHDLYHCTQGGSFPTVVARYGDNGPEYTSGIPLSAHVPALAEAMRRATRRGLL